MLSSFGSLPKCLRYQQSGKSYSSSTSQEDKLLNRFSVASEVTTNSEAQEIYTIDSVSSEELAQPTTSPQHYNDWPNAVGFDTTYEEHEPIELHVQGHIPAYAAGVLFRTAIGPRTVSDKNDKIIFKTNHWFDSFSQVHRFQLHAPQNRSDVNARIEKVTYNSRLSSDKLIARIQETGKADHFTFGANYEPCKSFFQKVQALFLKEPDYAPNEVNNAVTMSVNFPGLSADGSAHPSSHDPTRTTTLCNKTDACRLQFLDPETLKPTGLAFQTKLHPLLTGPLSAAHPEVDPFTGDVYSYNLEFTNPKATFRVFRTSASTAETTILATISHPGSYIHSLYMTEHFVILCIWNCHFLKGGLSLLWNRNVVNSMYFNDTMPATWFVIDRRCPTTEGGKGIVAKFESDPYFAFHTVNAYETQGELENTVDIVCDVAAYTNTDVLHYFYMDNIISSAPTAHEKASQTAQGRYDHIRARLQRYRLPGVVIPSKTDTSIPIPISAIAPSKAILVSTASAIDSPELPTIHPSYATRPHRYVYGIQGHDGTMSSFVDALIKYDMQTTNVMRWCEKGQTPGEAIFVPKPGGRHVWDKEKNGNLERTGEKGHSNDDDDNEDFDGEDDGIILTVVLDGYTGLSYLLCLDAKDLTEMGHVNCRGPVGFGFHGVWTGNS